MSKIKKRISLSVGILLLWVLAAPSCMTMRTSDKKAIAEFQEKNLSLELKTLSNNGHDLHYAKIGSDTLPTLIFVHGSPGSWHESADYLNDKDLLQHFRMVSIDRPGFGYSEFRHAFNLQQQSDIISPLFKVLENKKPMIVIGHSLGGPMIVKLAADNPTTFSTLVILAGAIDPAMENPEKWRKVFIHNPLQYLLPGALKPSNEELWMLKKDLVLLKSDFPKIQAKVYMLHGDKDRLVPYGNLAYGQKMFGANTHFEGITITGKDHFIPWTNKAEIKALLLKLK
jgi:pimeloyl-ACP methyl ester carboxylesterase